MKNSQIVLIAVALIGIVLVFQFGNIIKPKSDKVGTTEEVHGPNDGHNHDEDVVPADINKIIDAAKKRLQPALSARIVLMEQSITRGDLSHQKAVLYDSIARIWQSAKQEKIAAYYFGESGKLENSEKKLNFAGHLLFEELKEEPDPAIRKMMIALGTEYYTKSLAINPNNEETILESSQFYIEGAGEAMKGVGQLLALVEKEPGNIPANTVLGRMAVESGQYDKAIERADKMIKLYPKLLEPYLFKAEALKRNNQKEAAIAVFESAKKIADNPEFSKDVDNYIQTFK